MNARVVVFLILCCLAAVASAQQDVYDAVPPCGTSGCDPATMCTRISADGVREVFRCQRRCWEADTERPCNCYTLSCWIVTVNYVWYGNTTVRVITSDPDPNCPTGEYCVFTDECEEPSTGTGGTSVDQGSNSVVDDCGKDPSPILIDVAGDGYALTDAARGVSFDINGDGEREQLSWTAELSDDAFLALDRDGNGRIDSGHELFGNYTLQVPSPERNGFRALAELDANRDGVVDAGDASFVLLRLWQDADHDGVSSPSELRALSSAGIERLHLDYKESKKVDAFGNAFRYRAKVDGAKGVERWAWDVFLVK